MTRLDNKTDSQLEFIRRDCFDAVAAFPESQKALEYLTTARECARLLDNRAAIQQWRMDAALLGRDLLAERQRRQSRWTIGRDSGYRDYLKASLKFRRARPGSPVRNSEESRLWHATWHLGALRRDWSDAS